MQITLSQKVILLSKIIQRYFVLLTCLRMLLFKCISISFFLLFFCET